MGRFLPKTKVLTYDLHLRVSGEMIDELEKISLFKHRKVSEVIRQWIGDQIETYRKRPDYRSFLKALEEAKRAGK
jgi:hypothetical protein